MRISPLILLAVIAGCNGGGTNNSPSASNGKKSDPQGLLKSDSQLELTSPFSEDELVAVQEAGRKALPGAIKLFHLPEGPGSAPIKLGTPLASCYIPYKSLIAAPTDSPQKLLKGLGEKVYFPVLVGESDGAEIEVLKKADGWEALPAIVPGSLRGIRKMRNDFAGTTNTPSEAFFYVSVPILNRAYLASRKGDEVTFIPIVDDLETGFVAGKPVSGEQLISTLKKVAEKQKNKPNGPG